MTTMTREEALTIVTSIVREHSRECREPKPCQDCELEAEAIAALLQPECPPVDYDALAFEIFSGADVDYNGNLTISELTKRLSKVLP